ncbi:MAG: hypothetical protein IT319_19735 [Anaerolineae bacterium]|nr:hypothetical protein [Anaerolineae bacterium]
MMALNFRDNRGVFAGVGVIIVAVIVTVGAVAVILNTRCTNTFWDVARVYPGAALVESESTFLGLQRAVYHTDDAPETVESWYAQQRAAALREGVTSGDFSEVPEANPGRVITADTTNGGSLITFAATCP